MPCQHPRADGAVGDTAGGYGTAVLRNQMADQPVAADRFEHLQRPEYVEQLETGIQDHAQMQWRAHSRNLPIRGDVLARCRRIVA